MEQMFGVRLNLQHLTKTSPSQAELFKSDFIVHSLFCSGLKLNKHDPGLTLINGWQNKKPCLWSRYNELVIFTKNNNGSNSAVLKHLPAGFVLALNMSGDHVWVIILNDKVWSEGSSLSFCISKKQV